MSCHQYFATTAKNMESLLVEELRNLGIQAAETRGGASFSGPLAQAYSVCLWSRVANRVLLILGQFPAATPDALYAGVSALAWQEHLDPTNTFAVEFNTSQSQITHSHYGALRVKDAIVDQFRERTGSRPSVQTERPDIQINVYLWRNEARISLDLSGESLHRRGYRSRGVAAPLKENLAAAILLRAGWPEIAGAGGALVDPLCGSGTLPIEAALMAADSAPGLGREHWGFLRWKQHQGETWQALLEAARRRRAQGLDRLPPIRGYDHDPAAVRAALTHVERAGLQGRVHVERRELTTCAPGREGDIGLVLANPPYGERLGSENELRALYRQLGEVLKTRFLGWQAAVFTGNPELGKQLGLRAVRRYTLYNGPIECKLLRFEVTPHWFTSLGGGPRPLPAAQRSEGSVMFANRLQKNLKQLGRWLRREDIQCYRLYDADLPEYAVAVDVYQGARRWVHVQEYAAPSSVDENQARRRLREALGVIPEVLEVGAEQLFFKVRQRQKGRSQYRKMASTGNFHQVREDGCRFLVNLEDYLDTGLFLDHRITRSMLRELASGRSFLNLFAYTATATVYAAKGGATATTSLDLSAGYLAWAQRNMALNGFLGKEHEMLRTDCLEWLRRAAGQRRFGLIFLDPPSFSSSKRMRSTFDVQRDHVALIKAAAGVLEPDGVLIFANNRRRFKLDLESLPELRIEDISRATLPRDFARNPQMHHCWKMHRRL